MRAGNMAEAVTAAKRGARVRPSNNTTWCRIREDVFPVRLAWIESNGTLANDIIVGDVVAEAKHWDIDDRPRRWPSIVQAVKHMEKTGDWGRPVQQCGPCNWRVVRGRGLYHIGSGGLSSPSVDQLTREWETKPPGVPNV
jgi:hypothetical protein